MFTAALLSLSTAAITLFSVKVAKALHQYRYVPVEARSDTPSVSVCIAARNETHALAQCLERVLKSDYEKLEILVLDDSSTDDTSLIIKSFANAGVRFIAGKPLPSGWLGKNHAYQTLLDEASGEYVMFLDVDTTLKVTSIRLLVDMVLAHNVSMISTLPRREDSHRASAILGTMRYVWELLIGSKSRPPAASALWMVKKDSLSAEGIGLAHYGMSVRPERHLARQLHKTQQYMYVVSAPTMGVGFEKHLSSQQQTATRLYYPISGRSSVGFIASLLFLVSLVIPAILTILFIFIQSDSCLGTWAIVLLLAMTIVMSFIASRTYGRVGRPVRVLLWPLIIAQEILLLVMSFIAYRFGTVTWKGRPVESGPSHADALKLDS